MPTSRYTSDLTLLWEYPEGRDRLRTYSDGAVGADDTTDSGDGVDGITYYIDIDGNLLETTRGVFDLLEFEAGPAETDFETIIFESLETNSGTLLGQGFVDHEERETEAVGSGFLYGRATADGETRVAAESVLGQGSTEVPNAQLIDLLATSPVLGEGFVWGAGTYDGEFRAPAKPLLGQGFMRGNILLNEAKFEPLGAIGSGDEIYAQGEARFELLEADGDSAEEEDAVEYGFGDMSLYPLTADGWLPVGQAQVDEREAELEPLGALGSEEAYAEGDIDLEPLGIQAFEEIISLDGGELTAPAGTLEALATRFESRAELEAPVGELEAESGWYTPDALQAPAGELDIQGENPPVGFADLKAPVGELEAVGFTGANGRADLRAPVGELEATGGARANLRAPAGELLVEARLNELGRFEALAPVGELDAEGTTGIVGKATLEAPAGELAPVGLLLITQPAAVLVASGGKVVEPATYAAYAVNLRNAGVTTYTGYEFDYVMRFRGEYYGVGRDGMFRLEGHQDDGENVLAVVETGRPDFGTAFMKRLTHAYLLVNAEDALKVAAVSGEGYEREFTARKSARSEIHTRRTQFARGVKARNWGIRVTHEGGERFELLNLEILAEELRRKI